jgi:hypothetical protein
MKKVELADAVAGAGVESQVRAGMAMQTKRG